MFLFLNKLSQNPIDGLCTLSCTTADGILPNKGTLLYPEYLIGGYDPTFPEQSADIINMAANTKNFV